MSTFMLLGSVLSREKISSAKDAVITLLPTSEVDNHDKTASPLSSISLCQPTPVKASQVRSRRGQAVHSA